jgi:hypothetical protein
MDMVTEACTNMDTDTGPLGHYLYWHERSLSRFTGKIKINKQLLDSVKCKKNKKKLPGESKDSPVYSSPANHNFLVSSSHENKKKSEKNSHCIHFLLVNTTLESGDSQVYSLPGVV